MSAKASLSLSITRKCPALESSVDKIVFSLSSKRSFHQGAPDLSVTLVTATETGTALVDR